MKPIYTGDSETDPFAHNTQVDPFVFGLHDGTVFRSFWGPRCIPDFLACIATLEPGYIYMHNGGKFDFFWLVEYATGGIRIINGRIVEMRIGKHLLRDSYAILPFALSVYKKTPIDYNKMHKTNRESNRREILDYLRDDCFDLWTLVTAFIHEFGNRLTVGGSALNQLKKFHSFECGGPAYDAAFRSDFYYGGRVQCFRTGIIETPLKIYDVNSMYPDVMRRFLHPVGIDRTVSDKIQSDTCFVTVEGYNDGAFPVRRKNGTLDFTSEFGTYHVSIHEWTAALDTGTFRPKRIIKTIGFEHRITFEEFVNHFYNARKQARLDSDIIRSIFYKFVLNSAYGKFAQNPDNFFEYEITPCGVSMGHWKNHSTPVGPVCPLCKPATQADIDPECKWCDGYGLMWLPDQICEGKYTIWRHPTVRKSYYNIATGASITGAARAMLLRGIKKAKRPIYCDTDSIICEDLAVESDPTKLGAWKLEGTGDRAAICGKKLYAIFDGDKCIKKAHKGANLTAEEILRIANGEIIETASDVPNFKWTGKQRFTTRRIRMTA